MAFDPAPLLALVARAEALVARLEGVLPAFGAFTGMHPIRGSGADRVFAIADGGVTGVRSRAPADLADRRAA